MKFNCERKLERFPIIAITASVLEAEIQRCLQSGMDEVLAKPLEMPKLKAALTKWMPVSNASEILLKKEIDSEPGGVLETVSGDEDCPIDPSALKDVFGDDEETFKEILNEFVDPATSNIDEINAAYSNRSAADVAAAAHKLKSSSRAVGAHELADLCLDLESAGKSEDWVSIDQNQPRLKEVIDQVVSYINHL